MLRITKQTDYGIVLLTHMASVSAGWATAPELALGASLPAPMVAKILKILAREGLLTSQRGAAGGYALARPPAEISVAQIITALEGPIAVTECTDSAPGLCHQEDSCPVRGNWNRINLAIRDALEGISLADMTASVRRGSELVSLTRRRESAAAATAP